jgi:hypothetical protein
MPAGDDATFRLVYSAPKTPSELTLGYSNGFLMGDLFDGLHYARTRVVLGI